MSSTRAKIAIDAMGGDHAPDEIVAGAIRAVKELDVEVFLIGDPQLVQKALAQHSDVPTEFVHVVESEGVVEMCEEPLVAIRRKPKASINLAMQMVRKKKADAVVSAGHSGAAMAAALLKLGRIKGIDRPAIGAVFPTLNPDRRVIVLDVGANVDSKPKYLEQFALMGTIYSKYVLGTPDPQVGLLNIGEEPSKGNELALKTHELLTENDSIPFKGNAEGRDVLSGEFDVVVCDGFTGNILLKFAESVGSVVLQILKEELPRGVHGKAGAFILQPNLKRVKRRIDHDEQGGALLFGVAGVCIISHGSSKAPSIFNAIRSAKDAIDNDVIQRIKGYTEQHQIERKPAIAKEG